MKDKTGGLAYPAVITDSEGEIVNSSSGMTLRDYFAGQALMGLLGNKYFGVEEGEWSTQLAEDCYRASDAMIKERDK